MSGFECLKCWGHCSKEAICMDHLQLPMMDEIVGHLNSEDPLRADLEEWIQRVKEMRDGRGERD